MSLKILMRKGLYDTMYFLSTRDRARAEEIQKYVGISISTLYQKLYTLIALELIEKIPDLAIRPMRVYYRVTGKGNEFLDFCKRMEVRTKGDI